MEKEAESDRLTVAHISKLRSKLVRRTFIGERPTSYIALALASTAAPDGPKLTKNQQTMFSLLHGAGQAGLTTEQWYEQAHAVDIGTKRKADLYDIRAALKSKGLVRQYGERWNVA